MEHIKHLFEVFEKSVKIDTFVKLTVSKPLRKKEGMQNVYIRLFVVDGKEIFQFKYRKESENEFQKFSFEAAVIELERLLSLFFRAATLFTLEDDLLILISKKKLVSYRHNEASFKNKLPEIPQGT
jgi:hypothetical protein